MDMRNCLIYSMILTLLSGCEQIDFRKEVWNIDGDYIENSLLTKPNDDGLYIMKVVRTTAKLKEYSFEQELIENMIIFSVKYCKDQGKENGKVKSNKYTEGVASSRVNPEKNKFPIYKELVSESECY